MIDATEARKISEEKVVSHNADVIDMLDDLIKVAAMNGHSYTVWKDANYYENEDTCMYLESKGYKVSSRRETLPGNYYRDDIVIRW